MDGRLLRWDAQARQARQILPIGGHPAQVSPLGPIYFDIVAPVVGELERTR